MPSAVVFRSALVRRCYRIATVAATEVIENPTENTWIVNAQTVSEKLITDASAVSGRVDLRIVSPLMPAIAVREMRMSGRKTYQFGSPTAIK